MECLLVTFCNKKAELLIALVNHKGKRRFVFNGNDQIIVSVSMLLISVWFHYFFQYNFNNLYSIKAIKIVELNTQYIRDFPRDDCARYMLEEKSKMSQG